MKLVRKIPRINEKLKDCFPDCVETFEDQQNPALDDRQSSWNYEDPNGRNQGPFNIEQVRDWRTVYPESFEDQRKAALDDRESRWNYEDPNGRTQGPFNLEHVRDWGTSYPGCEANGNPIVLPLSRQGRRSTT
ncbi:hypothetical protein ACHQM5_002191 [Ranunculus cassubicifolius]